MTIITLADLKPFQKRAAGELAAMIQEYPSDRFEPCYDRKTGRMLPFLCSLRAITGAGKTPILGLTAQFLETGIILWTTNRGAVVSQTFANFQPNGKYGQLLTPDTEVRLLGDLSADDWKAILQAESGLTILLATVASFNQDGNDLKIHRKYGELTHWERLGNRGDGGRHRPLYVFYDEGHGATKEQFKRLRQLNPRAFVLASASPLPGDLADLLPGDTDEERVDSLRKRTVVVPTKEVVEAGLLKKRLYFMDCDTTLADAVLEAQNKWEDLEVKLASYRKNPIACFIVNETERGVDVWEQLVNLGVSPSRIAVHLDGAEHVMLERKGYLGGLVDTYSGKKPENRSPEVLRAKGYTHIIWNITLREGWDEPFAYVAYLDASGRSPIDITQKIGRFVRQPEGIPFDDPDLNAAYFYFRISDEEFTTLLRSTQEEMETDGYEIIATHSRKIPPSRVVEVLRPKTVPIISPWFGDDLEKLDEIILDHLPMFHEESLASPGFIHTRVIDMSQLREDEEQRAEVKRDNNEVVTPWQYLSARLASIDSRIIDDKGTVFTYELQTHRKMRQKMQYGSDAMRILDHAVEQIVGQLNEEFQIVVETDSDDYTVQPFSVKPFKLVSPDMITGSETYRERCRVHHYNNAVHGEYNGMNPFEVKVSYALDSLGEKNIWCRNPVGSGYKIPIPYLGSDTIWFYPDFLLWTDKEIWLLDPKGKHLVEPALRSKLLDLSAVSNLPTRISVALLLDGNYDLDNEQKLTRTGKEGFTLIRRTSLGVRPKRSNSLTTLLQSLVDE